MPQCGVQASRCLYHWNIHRVRDNIWIIKVVSEKYESSCDTRFWFVSTQAVLQLNTLGLFYARHFLNQHLRIIRSGKWVGNSVSFNMQSWHCVEYLEKGSKNVCDLRWNLNVWLPPKDKWNNGRFWTCTLHVVCFWVATVIAIKSSWKSLFCHDAMHFLE